MANHRAVAISVFVAGAICYGINLKLRSHLSRQAKNSTCSENESIATNEEEAIAASIPYYPFKGIDRFYDISQVLCQPRIFKLIVDIFICRFRHLEYDMIAGIDARGFVFGAPLAILLEKPFVMVRKADKLPRCVTGKKYAKEYEGEEQLSVAHDIVKPGHKILLVDDLIATGGSVIAALDLIYALGATCAAVACVVEIKSLNARKRLADMGYNDIELLSAVDENRIIEQHGARV